MVSQKSRVELSPLFQETQPLKGLVGMVVDIDKAGRDDAAGSVDQLWGRPGKAADVDDLVAEDADVGFDGGRARPIVDEPPLIIIS